MSTTSGMNIIIGQGTAIKEVHNIKKQNLELNQQFVAQETDHKKKETKSKVQEPETENKIVASRDEDEKKNKDQKRKKRGLSKEGKGKVEDINLPEGNIIDIVV
jgi:hypothetical protein